MIKIFAGLLTILMIFVGAANLLAWSDDVSGVMMPEPRGGGGISDQNIRDTIYGSDEEGSDESPVLIDWE